LDSTGASAWTFHRPTGQYYLHNFLPSQPDLNWWNPEVHQAFDDIIRFWFDRGVAGFRIDVAHGLYKDRLLRDNPPDVSGRAGWFGQAPVYNTNQPEVHDVYRQWRKIADSYDPPRLLLGETWVMAPGDLLRFYGDDDELQLCFNFIFVLSRLDATSLSSSVAATMSAFPETACPVWVGSNHDISRFPTRWAGGDPAKARLAMCILATLPGTLVLYQGDELGLTDIELTVEQQRDAMTRGFGDGRFTRDSARTPMPWDESTWHGFSDPGVEPWLPMGDRKGSSVAAEEADASSFLHLTRSLIALRRGRIQAEPSSYAQLPSGPQQWVYRSGSVVVVANFSDTPVEVETPPGTLLLRSGPKNPTSAGTSCNDGRVSVDPWEALIIEAPGAHEPTKPGSR
jgi:alpha-glucosidase